MGRNQRRDCPFLELPVRWDSWQKRAPRRHSRMGHCLSDADLHCCCGITSAAQIGLDRKLRRARQAWANATSSALPGCASGCARARTPGHSPQQHGDAVGRFRRLACRAGRRASARLSATRYLEAHQFRPFARPHLPQTWTAPSPRIYLEQTGLALWCLRYSSGSLASRCSTRPCRRARPRQPPISARAASTQTSDRRPRV